MIKALQFHRITPKFQLGGTWNRPNQFERFLEFLIKSGCRIGLPGEEGVELVLCFDDGDRSVYEYAFPLLRKYNIKALIFLVAGFIGKKNYWDVRTFGSCCKHLCWEEILEMHSWGIRFGSHTMTHRNLTRLNQKELQYELLVSRRILEERLGRIDTISYPFNRVNPAVIRAVEEAGYKFGFGGDGSTKFLIKKEAIYIVDNLKSFYIKVWERPLILYRYERLKQRIINFFTLATMLKKRR